MAAQGVQDQWIVLKGNPPITGICRLYNRTNTRVMIRVERLAAETNAQIHAIVMVQGHYYTIGRLIRGQLDSEVTLPGGKMEGVYIVHVPETGLPELLLSGGNAQAPRMETMQRLLRENTHRTPTKQPEPVIQEFFPPQAPAQDAQPDPIPGAEAAAVQQPESQAVFAPEPDPAIITPDQAEPPDLEAAQADPAPNAATAPERIVYDDWPDVSEIHIPQEHQAAYVSAPGTDHPTPPAQARWPVTPIAYQAPRQQSQPAPTGEPVRSSEGARHPEREQVTTPSTPLPGEYINDQQADLPRRVETGFVQMMRQHTPITPFPKTYPNSTWVRVEAPAAPKAHYITGILYADGDPVAFCWGIPGSNAANPPPGLPDHVFQPLESDDADGIDGYWLFHQRLCELS